MEENNENAECVLKVAASADVQKLANAITSAYRKDPEKPIILRAIGAGAVNQATKAAIVSGSTFSRFGLTVYLVPSFKSFDEKVGDTTRETVAIEFRIALKRS